MFSCFFWTVPFVTGEPRSVSDYFRDLPVHLRHHWSFVLSFGIHFLFRLRICLFILTLFGIIPESALGILGHLDYFLVAAMILICACILYRDFFVQAWKTVTNVTQIIWLPSSPKQMKIMKRRENKMKQW